MAGGRIHSKSIFGAFQAGSDKSLIINSNYAYIAPWTFESSWNEIQLGLFMSFVQAGDGNENIGFPNQSSTTLSNSTEVLGATANDEFFYWGIGRTGETQSIPSGADNSGFIGMRGDAINFRVSNQTYNNRILNISEADGTGLTALLLWYRSSTL